jgi:hypothetical protein
VSGKPSLIWLQLEFHFEIDDALALGFEVFFRFAIRILLSAQRIRALGFGHGALTLDGRFELLAQTDGFYVLAANVERWQHPVNFRADAFGVFALGVGQSSQQFVQALKGSSFFARAITLAALGVGAFAFARTIGHRAALGVARPVAFRAAFAFPGTISFRTPLTIARAVTFRSAFAIARARIVNARTIAIGAALPFAASFGASTTATTQLVQFTPHLFHFVAQLIDDLHHLALARGQLRIGATFAIASIGIARAIAFAGRWVARAVYFAAFTFARRRTIAFTPRLRTALAFARSISLTRPIPFTAFAFASYRPISFARPISLTPFAFARTISGLSEEAIDGFDPLVLVLVGDEGPDLIGRGQGAENVEIRAAQEGRVVDVIPIAERDFE